MSWGRLSSQSATTPATVAARGAAGAALQSAIGAGNLRAYVQGQDDVGHAALSN